MALLGGAAPVGAQAARGAANADHAARVIEQARGTNEFMCELALRSIDNRFGGGYWIHVPDAATEQRELLEWATYQTESADAIPVLSDALSDRDPCVRRVAARLLGHVKHPRALEALLDRLRSGDAQTREMAAIGLGHRDDRNAAEALLRALTDRAATVRAAVAWALGEIEDRRAIEALTRALKEDPDPTVRRQAAWALGEIY
jgi:HEAT repeat protein